VITNKNRVFILKKLHDVHVTNFLSRYFLHHDGSCFDGKRDVILLQKTIFTIGDWVRMLRRFSLKHFGLILIGIIFMVVKT